MTQHDILIIKWRLSKLVIYMNKVCYNIFVYKTCGLKLINICIYSYKSGVLLINGKFILLDVCKYKNMTNELVSIVSNINY